MRILILAGILLSMAGDATAQRPETRRETASLVPPPAVPPALPPRPPARVTVRLEARELVDTLADGVPYVFWTFGGQVPGNFLRVREGDLVEFHLRNHPDSRMPHNIDLHAATGPGGGAAASFAAPGHETTFEFRAQKAGLYVYHCATSPVGMHVANGMYGLILVEPPGGLPPVEREFYVMQGEFYTDGVFGEAGLRRFSMEKALREAPDYVVFNGAVGALTDGRALRATTGERLRLFVGNAGPNLTAAFHVTGEVFDRVRGDAGAGENVQTLALPPGGAAIVELRVEVPGTYVFVDHAVFRAFNKGAFGHLRVEGPANPTVFAGRIADDVYLLEGAAIQTMPQRADSAARAPTLADRIESGRRVFSQTCQACHQADGRGIPGSFPPLAGSDFLNADPRRAVRFVLNGFEGPIVVNGRPFNSTMPALRLTDADIADVLTYVFSLWGNAGVVVTEGLVREIRVCPWCETSRP